MIYSVPTKVLLDTVHKDKKKWFVLKKLKYFSLCFLEKQDFLRPDHTGCPKKNFKIELDPVGSTVRYEMMKLCAGSV